ncbi:MAG: ATP-binding protein, partial [Aquabacterium sp.]
ESAALAGLGSAGFDPRRWHQRPLRAPHHSASAVALVGGGSPPRPGEISLAHGGVLFLDELPEFPRAALEALREPLEAGCITISRAGRQATFPAVFQLVAAMNPCPCGWLGAGAAARRSCRCTPDQVARYQARLSGPLLDRLDLQVEVPALPPQVLLERGAEEPSAPIAARVADARSRALHRQGMANARLDTAGVDRHAAPAGASRAFVEQAAHKLGWSARALHRVLRVARSVADLDSSPGVELPHLAEAMQYRRVLPGG